MNKIIYGATIGMVLAMMIIIAGSYTGGAPTLTYVYSDSMDPAIKVNDAFIVWPDSDLQVGDIVMYRPVVLNASYITHRIIGNGESGFITRGDNSPFPDQEAGEPEVTVERIVGKVLSINGQPLIFPEAGTFSALVQQNLGEYARYLSGLLLISGLMYAIFGSGSIQRKLKSRRRLRLRHIYRAITVIAVVLVIFSMYLGSHVTQVKYLVSEYPGNLGDQTAVNQLGQLTMTVKNNGLVPVWNISTGIAPLIVSESPEYLWPLSEGKVIIDVPAHRTTGVYQGYVHENNYPIVMPRPWMIFLYGIDPLLALAAVGLMLALALTLLLQALNNIPDFEGWIPVRALRDKITDRRIQRTRAKLLGRRRIRPL